MATAHVLDVIPDFRFLERDDGLNCQHLLYLCELLFAGRMGGKLRLRPGENNVLVKSVQEPFRHLPRAVANLFGKFLLFV